MSKINVLDKHTAELIAAGEVVERPSSVVKEMVENLIDAGATSITVEIQNGGISLIRITDNGCGIERDDVRKAFLRHATSKISSESDLESIATLGFRGEALASISSVAKVTLLTKSADEQIGTSYTIEGGEEISLSEAGCPSGTTIIVSDLFYNTPARMKFLKKNVYEANAVADVMDRLALSHPEVSFRFIREGKETMFSPGDGKLFSAIYSVLGKEFASTLIPVNYEYNGILVDGYISKPVNSRSTRNLQMFFLNGRFVKTQTGAAALSRAYENQIMVGKFPACVLQLKFNYEFVDVNVHPAKTEVRFSDERVIFEAIFFAARNALQQGDERPEVNLLKSKNAFTVAPDSRKKEQSPENYSQLKYAEKPQTVTFSSPMRTPVHSTPPPNSIPSVAKNPIVQPKPVQHNTVINQTSIPQRVVSIKPQVEPSVPTITETPKIDVRMIGEAFNTYAIAQIGEKLLLIDKHAAHERIIFDRLKEQYNGDSTQLLLNPVSVVLTKAEYNLILENADILEKAGFLIDDFGGSSVVVRGVPMVLETSDAESFIEDIAQRLSQKDLSVIDDKVNEILHTAACRAAIKGGEKTSIVELKALAQRIVEDDTLRYCPHGRPVAMWLTKHELEKQFKRIQ